MIKLAKRRPVFCYKVSNTAQDRSSVRYLSVDGEKGIAELQEHRGILLLAKRKQTPCLFLCFFVGFLFCFGVPPAQNMIKIYCLQKLKELNLFCSISPTRSSFPL